jgi:hypothetical protein
MDPREKPRLYFLITGIGSEIGIRHKFSFVGDDIHNITVELIDYNLTI